MLSFEDDFFLLPDEVVERVLVIGGGIAGIQAALDVADAGCDVILVEREPSLGGRMAQLESMFPTLDHAVCALRAKMVEVITHPRITALTYSSIEAFQGLGGEFEVGIKKRTRKVTDACTGCGICWSKCPREVSSEFDLGLGRRKTIFIPFAQAIPRIPSIDVNNCYHFAQDCQICSNACPVGCIDFDQQDQHVTQKVGAVIVATGFKPFDPVGLPEYGFGKYPDVITSLQLERLLSGAGPTKGEVYRPSDGNTPRSVVFVSCVGPRDGLLDQPNCSRIGCINTAKQAVALAKLYNGIKIGVFYPGPLPTERGSGELLRRARDEFNVEYLDGKVTKIEQKEKALAVVGHAATEGGTVEREAELVVLAVEMEASTGIEELAAEIGILCDRDGYLMRADVKLQPVETTVPGIFVAGAAAGPCDIGESVVRGSAAATRAIIYLNKLRQRLEKRSSENLD
ncbi:MAG: CoB--CoM heterodisulfide reductase iron-sulfur subunit A family protein [Chloroflexi bacterium]|nr:CoB--CoM heterodisulfide reductase iron-sulfur subunit A family protein [Chloroflexota bacterium]